MSLQGSSEVVAAREANPKLVIDAEDLDEVTFDRYNEETFAAMEEWNPENDTPLANGDAKKVETKDPGEIMTLINSSFNSLDLDLSSEDRELPKHQQMLEGTGNSHQRPQQHTSWGPKQFEDPPSSTPANYAKRVTFQQDRRAETMFPQNTVNYPDDRNAREVDDELRRPDPYQDHARTRFVTPQASSARRNASTFGCSHYKEPQRNVNVTTPHTFARRSGSFRQDNFDLRNVETFGIDAVERQQYAAVPIKSPGLPYVRPEEEFVPPQTAAGYSDDNVKFPEIRDPRVQDLYYDTCRRLKMEPMYSHLEDSKEEGATQQPNDYEYAVLEHLKNIAELIPKIEIMEDVFDRLTDPEDPPCEQVRMEQLDRLKQHVTPQNVLPFSKMVHARRLLMHSLSVMSREKRYRVHVLEILEEIFRNLGRLLIEDRNDVVFGLKKLVFQRIISKCSMEEIMRLTRCLLVNNSDKAIRSTLGLWFIGCLLEMAANLDYESYPIWVDAWLPRLWTQLTKVERPEALWYIVREPGIIHLVKNTKTLPNLKTAYDPIRSSIAY